MEKLRRGFAGFCSTFSPAACWKSRSCVKEGNQRGPGQMFPFTNAAKEQGMPSSLPWPYLHFTTYSNNHATSSLGKEKYQAAKERFIIVFVKRAKTKLFFMPVLKLYLVSLCQWNRTQVSQASSTLITSHCPFAQVIAAGVSDIVNSATPEPPGHFLSIFQNKLVFDLAERTVSPSVTVPQTKCSKDQTWKYPCWKGAFQRHSSKPQSWDTTCLIMSCQIQFGN